MRFAGKQIPSIRLEDHLSNPGNRILIGLKSGRAIDADCELIVFDSFLLSDYLQPVKFFWCTFFQIMKSACSCTVGLNLINSCFYEPSVGISLSKLTRSAALAQPLSN